MGAFTENMRHTLTFLSPLQLLPYLQCNGAIFCKIENANCHFDSKQRCKFATCLLWQTVVGATTSLTFWHTKRLFTNLLAFKKWLKTGLNISMNTKNNAGSSYFSLINKI